MIANHIQNKVNQSSKFVWYENLGEYAFSTDKNKFVWFCPEDTDWKLYRIIHAGKISKHARETATQKIQYSTGWPEFLCHQHFTEIMIRIMMQAIISIQQYRIYG